MKPDIETLKAWCHWKEREHALSEDDRDFVNAIRDLISQVGTWKSKYEDAIVEAQSLRKLVDQWDDPESGFSVLSKKGSTHAAEDLIIEFNRMKRLLGMR